ncbi:GNAT family N-acetyltransferase [Algoriphagus hitonicola]|uniref:Protein N-acetyltransferase, RimJ/RimL family n=1 Tax=Algoriphagus hitonicola TaxID=435880 RepID=A0A1I2VP23_9BACT|nr:GNAT family protein [Algoriphagus hitonicola]SFG90912.1 Protein N-acetyltransferase, RimJ/RimL family [Algoriphagus hitonicola]
MPLPYIELENESILLRPLMKQDFSLLVELCQDKTLWEYFTYDLSREKEFEKWAEPGFTGDRVQFSVIDKVNGQLMGSTAFGNYAARDQRIEIGWTWLGSDFHGKGINPQMKFLMLKYAFETLKLKRVEIKTDVLNLPARKALLKMGIVEEGILRSHTLLSTGRRRDTIYYSVLESEWPELKINWQKK